MFIDALKKLIPSGLLEAPGGARPSSSFDKQIGETISKNPNLGLLKNEVRRAAANDDLYRNSRWMLLGSLPLRGGKYQAVVQVRANSVDIGYQGFGVGSPGKIPLSQLAAMYGGEEKFQRAVTDALNDMAAGVKGDSFEAGRAVSREPGVLETTKRYGKFQERGPSLAVIEPVIRYDL